MILYRSLFLLSFLHQNVQASAQTVRELLPVMRELAPQMRDFGLQVVSRLTDKMTARFLRYASDTILGPAPLRR